MAPLTRIAAERERMSAIERRIADFVSDNAHLLRDYSSQQLANTLGISQSSVVKFAQKFGYRGYPDLKYSVGVSVARAEGHSPDTLLSDGEDEHSDIVRLLHDLQTRKQEAQRLTRAANPPDALIHVARQLDRAPKVFVLGLGDDGVYARELTLRLSLLGMLAMHHADTILMQTQLSAVRPGDVLMVLSEFGHLQPLIHVARQFQDGGGQVLAITRHTANPLRALADDSLGVCAHDPSPHVSQLLYRASLQCLLDELFVLLGHANPERQRALAINLERVAQYIDT